ncbi:MAG: metal-dependent transcriptional regulator [Ruminococcaceae bacterium]|nr:metal-dependent transcriptional regulator [Oscillospiraceae bacterium]
MQESGEMYLESIYVLTKKSAHVRSIDVCEYMGYSKPSISRAMGLLKASDHIHIDNDGYITLTESGKAVAERIYERHTLLTRMLVRLGVSEETAAEDACRMEHILSEETFSAIKKHLEDMAETSEA